MYEEDIYTEDSRVAQLENDEISSEEEGFMLGYDEALDFI